MSNSRAEHSATHIAVESIERMTLASIVNASIVNSMTWSLEAGAGTDDLKFGVSQPSGLAGRSFGNYLPKPALQDVFRR